MMMKLYLVLQESLQVAKKVKDKVTLAIDQISFTTTATGLGLQHLLLANLGARLCVTDIQVDQEA